METKPGYEDVLKARQTIGDKLASTPLVQAFGLEPEGGLWLKGELFQRTGSFKPRGALNWVRQAPSEQLERGLVTVSAGNHAQALAWAARQRGVPVTVVMPADASPMKVEATRSYGAEVILHGQINDALAKMEELRQSHNLVLVHPYDNPQVIAGQGTVGLEILEQLPEVNVIACPIGGGGLISGMGIAVKEQKPEVRLVGVEPEGAATLKHAWEQGSPARLPKVETVAASLGAAVAGELTYELSRQYVDEIVTLSEEEIVEGLRAVLIKGKLYAEPGGAIAASALLCGKVSLAEGEKVVAVISGGNLDLEKLGERLASPPGLFVGNFPPRP